MRIAQVIKADSWGEVTPEALERGIGGREGALIRLATEWAKLGHEVTNFVPVERSSRYKESMSGNGFLSHPLARDGYHEYVPLKLARHMLAAFPYDAVVAWECPSIFDNEQILEKQKVRLTHMQVAHLADFEMEAASAVSTGVVALSPWARDFLVHSGLENPNLYVRPNGVDISQYPLQRAMKKSHEYSFVYSSSPDRGLWNLLTMWPQIRSFLPDAKLYVAYGVDKYVEEVKWAHSRLGAMALDIIDGMKQPGVIDVGKIGQKKLAELQLNASAWLYPADTIQATETGCITAIENMAAGNVCFITDVDCLKEEFQHVADVHSLPLDVDKYVGNLVETLTVSEKRQVHAKRGREFAETRDWGVIAPTWIDLFKEQQAWQE